MKNRGLLFLSGLILVAVPSSFGCRGGSGGGGGGDPGASAGPSGPPPLSVTIQSITNDLPGIYTILFLLTGDGLSAATAKVEYSANGVSFLTATQVGGEPLSPLAVSPSGTFHVFVWNALLDLGIGGSAPSLLLRISASDADETASPVLSSPVNVSNSTLQSSIVQSIFPNLADIQSQASSKLAGTSFGPPVDTGDIRAREFTFSSGFFEGSGTPTNVIGTNPNWKKDVWTSITGTLYTLKTDPEPTEYLILQLATEDTVLWSGDAPGVFPEFDDGSISGFGNPALLAQGLLDEFVNEVVSGLHLGVVVLSGLPQVHDEWAAALKSADAAYVASMDEALFRLEPRWNLTTGHAEALLRTATAIEKCQGVPFGSYKFLVGDTWQGGAAALLAAIVDSRVKGAAAFSGETGRWDRFAEAAAKMLPGVESFLERARKQIPFLHFLLDLPALGVKSSIPSGMPFANAFLPAYLAPLAGALGKPSLIQGATSDPHYPLQLREAWFDEETAPFYPGLACRFEQAANFGHGIGSPQPIRNWRSFAASVFRGRPRPELTVSSTVDFSSGVPFFTVTATVKNPDPAKAAIKGCRLRFAGDDDDDWRYKNLAAAQNCTEADSGVAEVCYTDALPFLHRGWGSLAMTTSGNPNADPQLTYSATLDSSTLTGGFGAFFAEVEDEVPGGVLPSVDLPTRSYTSGQVRLFTK